MHLCLGFSIRPDESGFPTAHKIFPSRLKRYDQFRRKGSQTDELKTLLALVINRHSTLF